MSPGNQTTRPTTMDALPIGVPSAGSNTSPQAKQDTAPMIFSPAGTSTIQPTTVPPPPMGHSSAGSPSSPQATPQPTPMVGSPAGSQPSSPRAANVGTLTTADSPLGAFVSISEAVEGDPAFLSLLADILDDLERVRIANENRLRQLTRNTEDSDGEVRGLGLDERNPYVRRISGVVTQIAGAEHESVLALQRLMRQHPLGPWVKATVGVGEKQAARLLAAIGDPYIRPELVRVDGTVEPSRPRLVSELWAFCGYHVLPAGVAPRRQRGQVTNWSTAAKTRAYLIAESCIKNRQSPFRPVYDDTRTKHADAVHAAECIRCGPAGKPALVGSPLSDGHKHARAMRAVSKEILRELWLESKRLHENAVLKEAA